MDPATIWQSAMDGLPLLALRAVAMVLVGLSIAMAACVIGAVACCRPEPNRS